MQCPKCGHVRTAMDTNPVWQCPACGIAYNKFSARLSQSAARSGAAFTPLTQQSTYPSVIADGSVWMLIGANVLALIIGYVQGWSLAELMLIYWLQSIIIGVSYVARIRALDKFSTDNFRINGKAVEPTASTKRQTAFFFLVHYGGFHLGYLVFILSAGAAFDLGFMLCAAAFAINHSFSYRYHRDLDRRGTPNIGTLMFTPYLRIIPMHLTIILGASLGGVGGLLIFGTLKTLADALMHVVEHKRIGHRE